MKKKILSTLMVCAVMLAAVFGAAPKAMQVMPENVHAAANYANDDIADYAYQVAAIVNRERSANGLSPLKFSDELSNAAIVRAQEIQTYFSHTRPNGTSCFTAITERGISYRYAGENIAYGQRNPEAVMNAWMNSSGHRANILSTNVDYIGVGVTYRNGTYYWTQFFARSNDLSGTVITEDSPSGTTPTTTAQPAEVTTTTTTVTSVTTAKTTTAATTKKPDPVTTTEAVTTKAPVVTTTTEAVTKPAVTTTAKTETKPVVTTTIIISGENNSCGVPNLSDIIKIIKDKLGIDLTKIFNK